MHEFSQEALASQLLSRNELGAADIDVLAAKVAAFHATIEVAMPDSAFGRPDDILRIALQNFARIRPLLEAPADWAELDALTLWAEREHQAHDEHRQRTHDVFPQCKYAAYCLREPSRR